MMRRAVLSGVLLLALPAWAQDVPDALLPEPAPAPPAPPALAPTGAPMAPQAAPAQPALPPGMTAMADGVVRIALHSDRIEPALAEALRVMGMHFAALPFGRITIEAQVAGPANDASLARRASLARAQAVKAALVAGGLDATRIDLRPLGRLPAAVEVVDVVPPGVASPNTEARSGR
ncbi:hypothetical protein AAFN86_13080 [Roseomonas sp. CAU 1739]|uniref:hypothetical protein n=1 Tax=Roseomonas sp. CAU 1739 TaxID=3140364 RepID=UPI00325B332F